MATGAPSVLICVPTYNERDNLPLLVAAIHDVLASAHVLVIDDQSPDGTGELADGIAARDDRVHVLHRARKEGLGRAYIAGFRWALARGYALVFEMDCDFSHQPRYLPEFVAKTQTCDLVLGSRYIAGGGTQDWSWQRRVISRSGNVYAQSLLGLPFRDLTGGFKCFRREVLAALPLDDVVSNGYVFQIELTWRAVQLGFRVGEVPIQFPDRTRGESKMTGGIVWEAMRNVWQLRLDRARFARRTSKT